MSTLHFVALVVLAVALSTILAIWYYQTHSIYRFPQDAVRPEGDLSMYEVVKFAGGDGTSIEAWITPREGDAPILLTFGGNFAGIDRMAQHMASFASLGIGIVIMRYRGQNGASGRPSEISIKGDALALYDQLDAILPEPVPAEKRFIYGFSLGTSPAVHVARNREVQGLVVEAGFDKLCRYQSKRLKGIPMCLLMWNERHEAVADIAHVRAPLLFGHGVQDKALPLEWAEALFSEAPDEKEFHTYRNGTHSNLLTQGFASEVLSFLKK